MKPISLKSIFSHNFLLLIVFYLLIYSVSAQPSQSDELRTKLLSKDRDYVFVIAHRADWRNAPENSIEAIESAIAMGVDMIEIDVRKTKDNQLVIIHDKTLDRTTDGSGYISDWTLDSLKTLHLRNGQGRVTGFTIPTLKEALMAAKGKVLINLDKSYDHFDQAYQISRIQVISAKLVFDLFYVRIPAQVIESYIFS